MTGLPRSEIIETLGLVGLGAGAAAAFQTPWIIPILAGGFVVSKGGQIIASPRLRQSLANMLRKIEDIMPAATAADRRALQEMKNNIEEISRGERIGLSTQAVDDAGRPLSLEEQVNLGDSEMLNSLNW